MLTRFLSPMLLLCVCVWAQEDRAPSGQEGTSAPLAGEPDSSAEEKPLTSREKAKELLDSAAEVVAAASPEVQVMGLEAVWPRTAARSAGTQWQWRERRYSAVLIVRDRSRRVITVNGIRRKARQANRDVFRAIFFGRTVADPFAFRGDDSLT